MNQLALDWDQATLRRDQGIQSSADHADADEEGWTRQALGMLVAFASEQKEPFLIEKARAWAIEHGLPQPDEQRAWGAVTRMAIARGRIEKVGSAEAMSSNRSLKHTWRFLK